MVTSSIVALIESAVRTSEYVQYLYCTVLLGVSMQQCGSSTCVAAAARESECAVIQNRTINAGHVGARITMLTAVIAIFSGSALASFICIAVQHARRRNVPPDVSQTVQQVRSMTRSR